MRSTLPAASGPENQSLSLLFSPPSRRLLRCTAQKHVLVNGPGQTGPHEQQNFSLALDGQDDGITQAERSMIAWLIKNCNTSCRRSFKKLIK